MKKTVSAVLAAIFIGSLMLFAACGPAVIPPSPTLKAENPGTTFEIDVWAETGTNAKTLKFSDYFDENDAAGVTYDVSSSDTAKATAGKSGVNAIVTPKAVGSTVVTLSAKQDGEVKVSVDINFTIVDTTPARYAVTGLGERKDANEKVMATVTGAEEAVERSDYNFQVVTGDYVGNPTISYTVGSGTAKSLNEGKEEPTNTFSFSIPKAEVNDAIAFGAITGLTLRQVFTVTGMANGTGYTMTAEATAKEMLNYRFKITLAEGYYPSPNAITTYTVGAGSDLEEKSVVGSKSGNEITFTIPAREVIGDITLSGIVTGLAELPTYAVNYTDGTGYSFTQDTESRAVKENAYYFRVAVDESYTVADLLEATYVVGEGTAQTIEGKLIDSYSQTYEFLIYRNQVTADIAITEISGLAVDTDEFETVALTITANKKEYKVEASPKAYKGEDYTFSILIPAYYEESAVVHVTSKVGTAAIVAADDVVAGTMDTEYLYTIAAEDITAAIEITATVTIGDIQTIKNLPDAYWTASAWQQLAAGQGSNNNLGTQSLPTDSEDGILKFTDTVIRREGGAGGNTPNGSAVSTAWEQVSFEVKTAGTIDMLFFSTSNTRVTSDGAGGYKWSSGDNWVRLYSDDNGFLNITTCQATVNNDTGALSGALGSVDVKGAYKTEFMRVDILYRTLAAGNDATEGTAAVENPGLLEIRLFINGEWAELSQGVRQTWSRVVDGNLITSIRRPNYGNRAAVWARGGEANSIYVQKVATTPAASE